MQYRHLPKITIITLLVIMIYFVQQRFFSGSSLVLPKGESATTTIMIQDGQIVDETVIPATTPSELSQAKKTLENNSNLDIITPITSPTIEKEIMITDGVKHSVPLDEILGGGPPQDGIPPIDEPKFISIGEADFLSDKDPGLALEIDGINRFYPFQILVWHEIINDRFPASLLPSKIEGSGVEGDGKRVLITYCPLCLSGIVFDPIVNGERVEFGTSGKLWNSNLVMYDRKTQSLWSQILGESILGEMTGTVLNVLPSDQIRYGEWKALHPDGQVLSRDTGATRFYGRDPYGDYYTTPGVFFPVNNEDDRLGQKDFVLGIVVNGSTKAYWPEAIKRVGELEDRFEGKTLIVRYESDIDAVRIFEKLDNGSLVRINPFPNFWFSWVAAHPDTELYK